MPLRFIHVVAEKIEITISETYLLPAAHCGVIRNGQDMETTWVSTVDEWIKKMWCISTMEYYPAIKKKEILPRSSRTPSPAKWAKVKFSCSWDKPPTRTWARDSVKPQATCPAPIWEHSWCHRWYPPPFFSSRKRVRAGNLGPKKYR